jgi:hypothetical protein
MENKKNFVFPEAVVAFLPFAQKKKYFLFEQKQKIFFYFCEQGCRDPDSFF